MRVAASPLTHSSFQRVVAADIVSTFGSLMSRLAIPWLAVLVLRASPAAMAWITMAHVAAGALAALLLGALVSGVLAERYGARALLFVSSVLLGVAALAALRLPRHAGARSAALAGS